MAMDLIENSPARHTVTSYTTAFAIIFIAEFSTTCSRSGNSIWCICRSYIQDKNTISKRRCENQYKCQVMTSMTFICHVNVLNEFNLARNENVLPVIGVPEFVANADDCKWET